MASPHPLLSPALQADYRAKGYWEDQTLTQLIGGLVASHPDRIAIRGEQSLTYGELWERARRLAGALQADGLEPGDFVLGVMSNSWQGVALALAVGMAGAALSPLSSRTSPTLALNLFDQIGARGFVLQGDLLAKQEWQLALDILRKRLGGRPVVLKGDAPAQFKDLPTIEVLSTEGPHVKPVKPDPGAPRLVLSTGGTTGNPKSVLHCDNTIVYAARGFAKYTGFTDSDVLMSYGPYGHASGSLFELYMPLLHGASLVPLARWNALDVAKAVQRFSGTYFITLGTHIFDLLALDPSADPLLKTVRHVTSGAGATHLYVDAERRWGFKIVRVIGLSECVGHAAVRLHDPDEIRLYRDGVPYPGIEYKLLDPETAQPVPLSTPGEYLLRGPSLFMGYLGRPELTAAAMTPDGFYRTGDLVIEDSDGYLTWAGRIKDVIRRGGLQIDAVELETILADHPKLAEVAVIGEPDPRLGERPVVVAVCRSADDRPELEDLHALLGERGIPKESMPERLLFIEALPRTEFGRIHRVELRKWVVEQVAHAESTST
jgi:acyl-coenzyme A synthetase/AMP-(fatty) acid ligase